MSARAKPSSFSETAFMPRRMFTPWSASPMARIEVGEHLLGLADALGVKRIIHRRKVSP
jgi:hypothetical protein